MSNGFGYGFIDSEPEAKAVVGGFSIVEVLNKQLAILWADHFAIACQCNQEVREIIFGPES